MKVTWLDDERHHLRAHLVRGWLHKEHATVYRGGRGQYWRYADNSNNVEVRLDWKLDRMAKRAAVRPRIKPPNHWEPLPRIPRARALKGG